MENPLRNVLWEAEACVCIAEMLNIKQDSSAGEKSLFDETFCALERYQLSALSREGRLRKQELPVETEAASVQMSDRPAVRILSIMSSS